jgi:hypothetical protein
MSDVFVRKASQLPPPRRVEAEAAALGAMDTLEQEARQAIAAGAGTTVEIGEVQISLSGFATEALLAGEWYRPFRRSGGDEGVEPAAARDHAASARRAVDGDGRPVLRVESRLWEELLPRTDPPTAVASDVAGDVQRFVCERFGLVLDSRSWQATVFLNREDAEAFDRALRIAASVFCIARRRVLVHSCGIEYRGRGFLFAGQSGAGKSTLAGLSDRYRVLSDETVLVELSPAGAVLRGTPFRGVSGPPRYSRESAPLAAVLFLVQSPRNALSPLEPAEAFRRLGSRTFVPARSEVARAAALGLVEEIVRAAPAALMEFTRDERFLGLLDEAFFAGARHA